MLSAFNARPIVELKQRDKSKIESVLAHGDKILVGFNTGSLRIYRVNEIDGETESARPQPGSGSPKPKNEAATARLSDLLREEEKFSKKPVQQLAIIKEANVLLSLSDGYITIHDLQSYELQERLEQTRGATTFAVTSNIVKDAQTGIPSIVSKLAVAVKRKIILWSWQDMEAADKAVEISLPASVKSVNWATATKIVAGMDSGFVLVDVDSQEVKDILRPSDKLTTGEATRFGAVSSGGMSYMGMGGYLPKPLATKLTSREMLLVKDVNTLFVDPEDGQGQEKRQIPWPSAPEAVGYSYPYLLALQPATKGALEVRNPDTLSLLQTISLPNAVLLHVPQPNISLAHAAKGFLVSSDRTVWRMKAMDYDSQVEQLISQSLFDEAISLLNMLEDTLLQDKEGKLRQVRIAKAHQLFEAKKFRHAFEYFSKAPAAPEEVISLFPSTISGDLAVSEGSDDDESSLAEDEHADEQSLETSKSPSKTSTFGSSVGKGMFGFGMGRNSPRKRADSDAASISSSRGATSILDGSPSKSKSAAGGKLEGKDFAVAVNELCRFLVLMHGQLLKILNVDGTLKETFTQEQNDASIYQQVRYYFTQDVAKEGLSVQLRAVATLVDTTLFKAYMLVNPGLAGSLFRLANFCDPAVVTEKLSESFRYTDLIDFLQGKKLHREALELLARFGKADGLKEEEIMPALRGPKRTAFYLQQLPPEMIDVILDFADWPLRADSELGMEIFLADTENAETLPRHRVLDFLIGIDEALAVRYLEHIIKELNDLTPQFHQRLAELYLSSLKDKKQDESERAALRKKLQDLLQTSAEYNRGKIFQMLPNDDPDFYEARAIVFSKMGQHKQALVIYVFQIGDYDKAEEYCNRVYLNEDAPVATGVGTIKAEGVDEASIYHVLLTLFLQPPSPYSHDAALQPRLLGAALSLLSRHGARLPAAQTLSLLPESLPVEKLYGYFEQRLRAATSAANEERIVARLRAVERSRVELAAVRERGRRVVVGDDRVCGVCGKRFGGAAIRVMPRNAGARREPGEVVHYGCFGKAGAAATEAGKKKSLWG